MRGNRTIGGWLVGRFVGSVGFIVFSGGWRAPPLPLTPSPCPSRLAANTVWRRRPKVAYSLNDASSSAESGTITKMQDVDVKK